MTSDIKIFGCYARHLLCCEVLVDCPPLPNSLSFWVHLVGAWNLTWYQSQRSRVRVLVEASFKSSAPFFISTFAPCFGCMWVGVLWSISGLPTSFQQLKLLGSSGWCMKPNKGDVHGWVLLLSVWKSLCFSTSAPSSIQRYAALLRVREKRNLNLLFAAFFVYIMWMQLSPNYQ